MITIANLLRLGLLQDEVFWGYGMTKENRLGGAERIRGELLKLGIKVSKRTVQRYMPKVRKESGQTWAAFLKNHAADIWGCDFTVVHDLLFRPLYIFIIIELKTRRIVHAAVASSPTDAWTAQQLCEATPWGIRPRFLIRDHDRKYGQRFIWPLRGNLHPADIVRAAFSVLGLEIRQQ